ncbi:MAG: hypothetical protein PHN69_03630 [Candidatus Pacebacteria bacterium]|nr:hypothetical protein [Fermentimonas sp.]MDD4804241.1 hypothetical protein [Candidatus Paceibacterota bacterium]
MNSIFSLFGKTLKAPLEVINFEVDGHFYVSSPEYKIYADSSTSDQAMSDFIEQIEDMYLRFTKLQDLIQ